MKKSQGQHQRIYIRRSIKKVGLRAVNKSGEKYNPGRAKRRALFPEGRGLGVGGIKNIIEKKVIEKKEAHPVKWMSLKVLK